MPANRGDRHCFVRRPGGRCQTPGRGRSSAASAGHAARGLGYPGSRVVSRRVVLIALLLAGAFAAPARSQPVQLIPGTPALTFEKQAVFTIHGLVGINVLVAPKPGGLWSLQPVLSNELIQGTEKLTAIEQRLAGSATTAGVNGDVVASGGRPDGLLERNGVLDHDPRTARTSIGVDTSGGLHFDRISLYGYWQGAKARHAFADLNEPPMASGTTLYTPAWGPATPAAGNGVAVVLRPFPAAAPNTDLVGTSAQVVSGGAVAIPPDGAVLVARGSAAPRLAGRGARGPVGSRSLRVAPGLAVGRRHRGGRRRAAPRQERQGGGQVGRVDPDRRPRPARAAHRRRAARGRQHRPRLGRRRASRLGPDEPRARADARPARRRQRRCARRRPDERHGLRRTPAEHACRRPRAAGRRRAARRVRRRLRLAAVRAGRVSERRRRRRDRDVHATRSSGLRPSRSSFAARTARCA